VRGAAGALSGYMVTNAFSVDLEDWFCVQNLSEVIDHDQWERCESRIEEATSRVLAVLERHRVHATFFVLGWIARHHPDLVRRIAEAGHEIASHGFAHLLVRESTPERFHKDLTDSLQAIRDATGAHVLGYRAPSFSVSTDLDWMFDILAGEGIRYDSSIFPFYFHPDYGNTSSHLWPWNITDRIVEFPMGCFRVMGMNVPCCGGGYFRAMPYPFIRYGIRKCNGEGRPIVFYVHPWELDPAQPRVSLPWSKRFRHYVHLSRTEERLDNLLAEFEFDTVSSVLGLHQSSVNGENPE